MAQISWVLVFSNAHHSRKTSKIKVNIEQLFAKDDVIIGENSPRQSRGEYSPQSLSLRRIIVLVKHVWNALLL